MWESVVNSEWGQRTALTKEQRVHLTNCHIYGAAVSMTTYEADFEKILRSHELRHAATEKAEKNGDLGALAESRLQEALEERHPVMKTTFEPRGLTVRPDLLLRPESLCELRVAFKPLRISEGTFLQVDTRDF